MNDDFLRRAWRRPPAAFEKQLRKRLRQQELAPRPSRPTKWPVLMLSILAGSSALATVTYFTAKHLSSESPTAIPEHFATREPQPREDSLSAAREPAAPSAALPSKTIAPAATVAPPDTSTRIAVTPQLSKFARDISSHPRYTSQRHVEIAEADSAFRMLCADVPPRADVVITARRIERQELETCDRTAAGGVMEAKLGHLATVVSRAKAGTRIELSPDAILRAVLKRVPSQTPHELLDNPYTEWHQIDPALETQRIELFGPARDSDEFQLFAASILEPACDNYPWLRALRSRDRGAYEQICYTLRDDGIYQSAPWDSNFVRQRLWADPNIVAIVDYPFYAANSGDLIGSLLAGPQPGSQTIVDGSYEGSVPVYLYVSRARQNRTPAVRTFVNEYLRRRDFAHRWMTAADGDADLWRSHRELPLIEVRLEEQRKQP